MDSWPRLTPTPQGLGQSHMDAFAPHPPRFARHPPRQGATMFGGLARPTLPPSVLPDISPTRGETGSFGIALVLQRRRLMKPKRPADLPPRGGDVRQDRGGREGTQRSPALPKGGGGVNLRKNPRAIAPPLEGICPAGQRARAMLPSFRGQISPAHSPGRARNGPNLRKARESACCALYSTYSAACCICGAALLTWASTCVSNLLKLEMNMPTSLLAWRS